MTSPSSSPSTSSTYLPFLSGRPRRGSLASLTSSKGEIDKDVLAQALNDIHASASRTATLTSFRDFDGSGPRNVAKDTVTSSVGGLYGRILRGLGGGSPVKERKDNPSIQSRLSLESTETAVSSSNAPRVSVDSPVRRNAEDTASTKSGKSTTTSPRVSGVKATATPVLAADKASDQAGDRSATKRAVENLEADADQKNSDRDVSSTSLQNPVTQDGSQPAELLEEESGPIGLAVSTGSEAANALTRVLTQHEGQPGDAAKSRSLRFVDKNGQALDSARPAHRTLNSASHIQADTPNGQRESEQATSSIDDTSTPTKFTRPPMARVGLSHLPGYMGSRASSINGEEDVRSELMGARYNGDASQNINTALQRRRLHTKPNAQPSTGVRMPPHLKRRVISKSFWMQDENAKDCFYCGQSFSTFRRKHHCRTCGQIFDAKCTSIVPGRPFGQSGTIRLCKPCEAMIYGSDGDDSTIFSDDGSDNLQSPIYLHGAETAKTATSYGDDDFGVSGDVVEVATPSIGIPASRRNREAKRRSAVIEFDTATMLTRPTSSHSLISLARRSRSLSHRRQHSRHQNLREPGTFHDEQGPFKPKAVEEPKPDSSLPAFHNDNIIDPDLAPFLSDEGSDDDAQPGILTTMDEVATPSPGDKDRAGFGGYLTSAMKRGRPRLGTNAGTEFPRGSVSIKPTRKARKGRNASSESMSLVSSTAQTKGTTQWSQIKSEDDPFDDRPVFHPNETGPAATKLMRSSAMRGRGAPVIELNHASLEHVRRLLYQMLKDSSVASPSIWEKALMPVILQCTNEVAPNVQMGDDMDIRHYIKLKKVPGGRPGDTSYFSGIVFSKNIALKSMARSLRNPRIAIISFALEYARHRSHFMSLEPVIAQEQEYLRNLVGRIAALRPDLLLVQRHISGTALSLLEKAGITVAFNIKESVLAAVARVTQTVLIKSVDKLAMDASHLGLCESFSVKTYVHEGLRKSYIYLSGCQPDLGCTLVLRGGDPKTLRKIKRITEFMCYVAYNLKLETALLRDEFVSIPIGTPSQLEAPDSSEQQKGTYLSVGAEFGKGESPGDPNELSKEDDHDFSEYEMMEQRMKSRILSASPFVVFMQPYVLTQLRDSERQLRTYRRLRDQYAAADEAADSDEKPQATRFEIVKPEMVHVPASKDQPKSVRDYLHAVHEAQLDKTLHTYETQKRLMNQFLAVDVDPFDPRAHQSIVVLSSTVSTVTSAPCVGPELLGIGFYAGASQAEAQFEEDCTLGQFVEDVCLSAASSCKECGKRMLDHHRQYVHGFGQLSFSVQRLPAKMRGYPKTIFMWATCRICKSETTAMPMSGNTWRYSFAKYLELSFWNSPLHPRAGVCQHDVHKDFLRCFGFEELVIRVQYDPVEIYNVVVPRTIITWKVESDLKVKNDQFVAFVARLNAFTESIRKRLDTIHVDTLDEKKAMEASELLSRLRQRAKDDHAELLYKLQQKYAESRYYELIPLNRALRFMDEKALAWDDIFNDFERDYFPSETDIRKLATLQLKNMFLESQPTSHTTDSDTSDHEDVTERKHSPPTALKRGFTDAGIRSDTAHNVLSSTVEKHRDSIADIGDVSRLIDKESGDALGETLARTISTPEEQADAVQREDVRHLDLALATQGSDSSATNEKQSLDQQSQRLSRPGTREGQCGDEPFATHTKPLGSGLLERIEQIRSTRPGGASEQEEFESKIPRPVPRRYRETTRRPSPPPMIRAQSSPSSPQHKSPLSTENDPEHSIDAVVTGVHAGVHHSPERRLADRLGVTRLTSKVSRVTPSLIPRSIPTKPDESNKVSALAKHFEQMSREFEKERLRERRQRALRSRQARANPLASSRPVVEVYHNATDAVGERTAEQTRSGEPVQERDMEVERMPEANVTQQEPDSHDMQSGKPEQTEPQVHSDTHGKVRYDVNTETEVAESDTESVRGRPRELSDPPSYTASSTFMSSSTLPEEEVTPELAIPEHKKSVWFKYLAEFWSKRSASGWANLEYPLRATEHVFEDSDIIVREDEPSSVIALSLACSDYLMKVQEFRSHPKKHTKQHSQSNSVSGSSFEGMDTQQKAIEASLLSDTGTHMKYSFAHGQVKALCKIFYAESFDALRRRCGVADRFVESLTRCLKFDSKGGKTKSLFLQTRDNRFYIKSLQEVELKAFTKFAPDYFAFMSQTLFHGVPSVIAKMFGLFQVTIKNPATGMDFSSYLLVMENLFYERKMSRRFDLKGSMRNRKVESTGQPDEVLLDENLVETIFESPLFVREHARKLLQASVWNDTLWLCKQNVMDYSLMAGFDDERKELVVGIIDCIRTYTWDKKLESWIKDRGKNKPTITSPKDYRNRFRVSMTQYVLLSPNCWHQVLGQMAMPKTLKDREREAQDVDEYAEAT